MILTYLCTFVICGDCFTRRIFMYLGKPMCCNSLQYITLVYIVRTMYLILKDNLQAFFFQVRYNLRRINDCVNTRICNRIIYINKYIYLFIHFELHVLFVFCCL